MKTLTILTTALLFMSFSTLSFGQETEKEKSTNKQNTQQIVDSTPSVTQQPFYVDKNNNGVCDHFESGDRRQGRLMAQGQGRGRGQCLGQGRGQGFGRGKGQNRLGGRGNNRYVDKNNNGICDRLEEGNTPQRLRDGSGAINQAIE